MEVALPDYATAAVSVLDQIQCHVLLEDRYVPARLDLSFPSLLHLLACRDSLPLLCLFTSSTPSCLSVLLKMYKMGNSRGWYHLLADSQDESLEKHLQLPYVHPLSATKRSFLIISFLFLASLTTNALLISYVLRTKLGPDSGVSEFGN